MKVNFNPDIELLIREVKMLKILGYNVPSEIEKVSKMGGKFLRQAKCLEQVNQTNALPLDSFNELITPNFR